VCVCVYVRERVCANVFVGEGENPKSSVLGILPPLNEHEKCAWRQQGVCVRACACVCARARVRVRVCACA